MKKLFNLSEFFAFFFMFIPIVLLVFCGIIWLVGLSLNLTIFPIGVVLSYCMAVKLSKSQKQIKETICISLSILTVLIIACYYIYDSSWDGYTYHQPAIAALSDGWNPIYQHHVDPQFYEDANIWVDRAIWVDHYAKGQETICATIVSTFGNIEIGKVGNFFLPLSGFFFCLLAIRHMFSHWSNRKTVLIAFIVAFPPITWNQVFTFYIDFVLYPLVIIALSSVVLYLKDKLKFFAVMTSVVAIAIGVKPNIFMWIGLLYLGILIYMYVHKYKDMVKYSFVYGFLTCFISIFSYAYNPYIVNTIDHGSPFYPLFGGAKTVDIMTHIEPDSFKGLSGAEKIIYADFARPAHNPEATILYPYVGYKLKNHILSCGVPDVRTGGTGLLWIDCLLLSLLVFILTKSYRRKGVRLYWIVSILFFITQFLVPGGWMYRYVSYIYLIPIFLVFASEWCITKYAVIIRKVIYGLLVINIIVAITITISETVLKNQIEDYYVKCINVSDKPCYNSDKYGFIRKINPEKRKLIANSQNTENIPFCSNGVIFENLNRNVETNFIQEILLKKGILK